MIKIQDIRSAPTSTKLICAMNGSDDQRKLLISDEDKEVRLSVIKYTDSEDIHIASLGYAYYESLCGYGDQMLLALVKSIHVSVSTAAKRMHAEYVENTARVATKASLPTVPNYVKLTNKELCEDDAWCERIVKGYQDTGNIEDSFRLNTDDYTPTDVQMDPLALLNEVLSFKKLYTSTYVYLLEYVTHDGDVYNKIGYTTCAKFRINKLADNLMGGTLSLIGFKSYLDIRPGYTVVGAAKKVESETLATFRNLRNADSRSYRLPVNVIRKHARSLRGNNWLGATEWFYDLSDQQELIDTMFTKCNKRLHCMLNMSQMDKLVHEIVYG